MFNVHCSTFNVFLNLILNHTSKLLFNSLAYVVLQVEQSLQVCLGIFHCGFLINGLCHDR